MSNNRRFQNSGEASKELFNGFKDWCSALATYSLQTAYAIIAANWAVHGVTNTILNNLFAKLSIGTIIGFLGLNLLCTGWMALLYQNRSDYTDEDRERWENEFKEAAKKPSPWPYTKLIQGLGLSLRILRTLTPIIAGLFFILSLFL